MLTYLYTAILIILISIIQQSYAIQCYVCNSARDPRCGDPFDSSTIEKADCNQLLTNQNSTLCRKNIQRVNLGLHSDTRVVRACGHIPNKRTADDDPDESNANKCFTRAGTFEVMVTYCSCDGEACNTGSTWCRLNLWGQMIMLLLLVLPAVVTNNVMV